MAPTDALISKTVDDAKNAKPNDAAAAKHVLDDIYDIKNRDGADPKRLKNDFDALNQKLHEQGVLPGLFITDASKSDVVVKGSDGKTQTLDAGQLGKTLDGAPKQQGKAFDGGFDHSHEDPNQRVIPDAQGRVGDITRPDGSTTHINYDGGDKNPNKITTTNKDGSTITFEKSGTQWTETTKPVNGTPTVNPNLDSVTVSNDGNITTTEGTVTQVFSATGERDVTHQTDKNGPISRAQYGYDANGQLVSVNRTTEDGGFESFNKTPGSDQWQMRTTTAAGIDGGTIAAANVKFNPDGGVSYDSGKAHVTVEGYGAKHVTEDTSYGTYEQSFDPSGKLTTVARTDNTTGKTELVSFLNGGKGSLLVYDTKNPDNYSSPDVKVNLDGSYSYKNDQGQDVTRSSDFTGDGLKQTPIDPAVTKVAKDNGLDVNRRIENGHFVYDYSVEVSGQRQTILSTDRQASEASAQLQQLRDAKLTTVEHDNNVQISRDGQTTSVDGKDIPVKTPNLGQLYGVEAALVRSVPDLKTPGGQPLQIDFLVHQGDNPNVGGFSDLGKRVVIEPNGGEEAGPGAVESVFLHELAHNGQADLYGKDKTLEDQYAGRLGFVRAGNDWLLITKDGRYFKSDPGKGGVGSSDWERTDKDGNPIDAKGNKSNNPQKISNDEARNLALIKPATTYFPDPAEAGAEGSLMFRGGEARRSEFLRDNPDDYNAIKTLDQLDLNKTYGLDSNGQPNYIRNPDGIPVPNTASNHQAVTDFENNVTSPKFSDSLGGLIGQMDNAQKSPSH